jgi:hypothetical protein
LPLIAGIGTSVRRGMDSLHPWYSALNPGREGFECAVTLSPRVSRMKDLSFLKVTFDEIKADFPASPDNPS